MSMWADNKVMRRDEMREEKSREERRDINRNIVIYIDSMMEINMDK